MLIILDEVMKRVKYDKGFAEVPKPCDYFDLIGGTSTGGYLSSTSFSFSVADRVNYV